MLAVALALAAAGCYAAAMVLEHQSARLTAPEHSLRPSLVIELGRRPLWLAGIAANLAGYGLRFVALGRGSLVVVQPLLGTSLLFALPASARWHREHLRPRDWGAAGALVVGLALFLVPVGSHEGSADAAAARWLAVAGCAVAATGGLLWRTAGASGAARARMLAAAGGVVLALTAAASKSAAVGARHDLAHLPLTWAPYAVVATGIAGVVVVQSAFAAAPLSVSLPVLMVVEPLASIVLGIVLFGEHVGRTAPAVALEVVGLGVMAAAITVAVRSPLLTGDGARSGPRMA